ncbi:MAG: hypothetical protein Q9222_004041 [Ikaeria aurantiellina]
MATVVLGSQWGDEGKGKLVDILCAKAQLCCRAQGGNNAGHTIVAGGQTYDFHILPSGLVNPKCLNLIGSGCVIHIPSFFSELDSLRRKNLNTDGRIFISDRAHVVFDLHLLIDGLQEGELAEAAKTESLSNGEVIAGKKSSGGAIGTTKKGIGPSYSAKHARSGVRIHQIFHKDELDRRLRVLAKSAEKQYGHLEGYDVEAEIARFDTYRDQLRPFVIDAMPLMGDAQSKDMNILVEGANALMLDIDHGTYPFCTSSATGIGGIFSLPLSPFKIKNIIGVVKAYTTRVGGGPFPSEQLNVRSPLLFFPPPHLPHLIPLWPHTLTPQQEDGSKLQRLGHEIGTTTGRVRRCGWLDLVVLKHSTNINHYTSLNLTKLDVLDTFPTIRIATAYTTPDKETITIFPADLSLLDACEPLYTDLPGWQTSTKGIRKWADLPANAHRYIEFIETAVGVKVKYVGTGPDREDMIFRE